MYQDAKLILTSKRELIASTRTSASTPRWISGRNVVTASTCYMSNMGNIRASPLIRWLLVPLAE